MGAIAPTLSLYTESRGPLYHKILCPPLLTPCFTKLNKLSTPRVKGSKKVLYSRPGQEEFPAGQVTVKIHLPNGQGSKQVASDKQYVRAAYKNRNPIFFQDLNTHHHPPPPDMNRARNK